jgi:hypothetical protein
MAQHNLESLLFRIRDGQASAEEVDRARALVASDVRLPDELREVVDFTDDPEGDAVGLLAVLGADSLFGDLLREGLADELAAPEPVITAEDVDGPWALHDAFVAAVAEEAGSVEVVAEVFAASGLPLDDLPIAAAIRSLAGEVEVADGVLARLGLPAFELPLAAAVEGEAGRVDLLARIEAELTDLGLPLAEAIAYEAGTIDVADAVITAVGGEARLPVAEAVRAEAGNVSVWPAIEASVSGAWVSAMLDRELAPAGHRAAIQRLHDDGAAREDMTAFASIGSELRTAVAAEAGDCPYVWAAIAEQIGVEPEAVEGWDGVSLAAAVREEAGTVDVAAAVMKRIDTRMPSSLGERDDLPVPANSGFGLSAMLMLAAVVVMILGVPQIVGTLDNGSSPTMVESSTQFASASEIVVEELDYSENSNVYQATGDQGALILWVDEGKTL